MTATLTENRAGSLQAGLDILEMLVQTPRGMGVTEIAARLGADKSNVHRLLKVLQARGYVAQDDATKKYTATVNVVELAGAVLRNLDIRSLAQPVMNRLLEETGESVHLALLTSRNGPVYVAQERPFNRVSVETEIGSRAPVHCTATGKALFAHVSDARLAAALSEPLERHTMRTHATIEALRRDLAHVREVGFAVDDEEYNAGVRCAASAVFDLHAMPVASIGFSGPASRVTLERLPELGALARAAAEEVTRAIGGSLPPRGGAPEAR